MKDSGNKLDPKNKFLGGKNCEWIGEIPDDWKISRLKYIILFQISKI